MKWEPAEYLQSKGLKPKFVLVLGQLIYSRNLETYQQSMATAPATMNVGGKSVKTGAVPVMMTRSDWYAAMENAFGEIRKISPFK